MTPVELQTCGDLGLLSLVSFEGIQVVANEMTHIEPGDPICVHGIGFVQAAMARMGQIPGGAKEELARRLPFSELELKFLQSHVDWADNPVITAALTERLATWISLGSVYIDDINKNCASYLLWLWPNLDRHVEREEIAKLVNLYSA